MKKKLTTVLLVLALVVQGGLVLNAQVLQKVPGTVGPMADSRQLPKDKNTTQVDKPSRGQFEVRRGVGGRGLSASNSVLRENKDTIRLPDSRLPEKTEPARPNGVLKKLVL